MKILTNIIPDIREKKVERFLLQRKGRKSITSQRTKTLLRKAINDCKSLIKPSVLYKEKPIREVAKGSIMLEGGVTLDGSKLSGAMRKCKSTTIFLVTIGNVLDKKIDSLMRKKRMMKAYLYDAIGSVAAEQTVEMFQNMFDSRLKENGKSTTLRFSPGYCDWRLEEQKKLFQLIDNHAIGVELRPNCLMSPRKSISGIFGVGNIQDIGRKNSNPCILCTNKKCMMRRAA
jgi:hypothetical protein